METKISALTHKLFMPRFEPLKSSHSPKAERDQRCPCLVVVVFCLFRALIGSCPVNNQSESKIEITKTKKTTGTKVGITDHV